MHRLLPLFLVLLAPLLPVARADPPAACSGSQATEVFTGSFDASLEGGYVMVPFDVTDSTTRVEARLCYDQPAAPTSAQIGNTLDLGLYDTRGPDGFFGVDGFRGWGGSSRLNAHVSPSGATNGFLPGDIPAREWAAEIGVAAVVKPHEGNPSGEVNWRLEIHLSDDPAHATPAWTPKPYDATARGGEGWYKGDFHVHAEHSGSAPMGTVFEYAFAEQGLDFITLSDYNTTRHHDEIGRFQEEHPGKLVVRSAEVITYRGHVNNHASLAHVDHRGGPVYEWPDLSASVRAPQPPSTFLRAIQETERGWTQVNHPTTFPSKIPGFANLCRGCSWEYDDAETDWSLVDAMEVQTGPSGWAGHEPVQGNQLLPLDDNEPGPNPFTPLAVEWWDRLRRDGHRVTAVGSSDSHRAGERSLLYSGIGHPTTVVYAPELSEQGIGTGVRSGHAYVKFFGPDGPDLRWEARVDASSEAPDAIMGDSISGGAVILTARVTGALPTEQTPQPRTLFVFRDGVPTLAFPVSDDPFEVSFPATAAGDWRLQLQRGTAIEALTNPITVSFSR